MLWEKIKSFNCNKIIFTGGEPTAQDLHPILMLIPGDYWVGIETNGTNKVHAKVDWISCSPKFQYQDKPLQVNFKATPGEFRLVVPSNVDKKEFIKWALNLQEKFKDQEPIHWYISPCETDGKFAWDELAHIYNVLKWHNFKISIQIHKLWGKQ